MDTMHEGYAGKVSHPMAALGALFASTMADPALVAGLEGYAVHGLIIDDPVPDPDRVSTLMAELEASILAARSKRGGGEGGGRRAVSAGVRPQPVTPREHN